MTYEELLINIELNGYENVLPSIGKTCLDDSHWFVVCDDGDCHLFDRYGKEDNISKIKEINEDMIPRSIKKIVIPNSVTKIWGWAFFSCSRMTNIIISDRVANIEYRTFCNCRSLISVTIPNNVTSIGHYAFYYCSSLTSVTIGKGVMGIGSGVFTGCSSLANIMIDKPIKQVKKMAFYPWGIKDESIIKCN